MERGNRQDNYKELEEWAFLTGCRDEQEANMLESFLTSENIFVLRKYGGAGDYLKVACGMTIFGIDLYVENYQLRTAQEILRELTGNIATKDVSDITEMTDVIDIKTSRIDPDADCAKYKVKENIGRKYKAAAQNKGKKRFVFIAGVIIIYILGTLFLHFRN